MKKKKTTIYLEEIDHEAIDAIRRHYNLDSDSAAIRLALSLVSKEISKKKGR